MHTKCVLLLKFASKWCFKSTFCSFMSKNHSNSLSSYIHGMSNILSCRAHTKTTPPTVSWKYLDSNDDEVLKTLSKDMIVERYFISEKEEQSLLGEVERYMKRLRYEYDHWDNAIHGFRETEKKAWNEDNSAILQRVKDLAFPTHASPIAYVHVLDIAKEGYIKPHVDSVRFCGSTIAGLCLLSPAVMRLALEAQPDRFADVLLPRRCLYVMKDAARFDYTHEVLKPKDSFFMGQEVPRDRRISIICRNEPDPQLEE